LKSIERGREILKGHLPSVMAQKGTRILRDNEGRFEVVSKELCYGKAETLEDAEEKRREGGGII
jgi:hypothetical protein